MLNAGLTPYDNTGRFTRKTLAFSKYDEMHEGLLKVFIYDYNLSCISQH